MKRFINTLALVIGFVFIVHAHENKTFTITMKEAGTLDQEIKKLEIPSGVFLSGLIINGPIDDADVEALCHQTLVSLNSIDLKNAVIEGNRLPDKAFASLRWEYLDSYSTVLETVILPDNLEEIGEGAFENCTNLKFVSIPSTVRKIHNSAFSNCTLLQDISLPEGLESVEAGCFYNCSSLKRVYMPSTLRNIRRYAFYNTALKTIKLPANLKSIGDYAFANSKLTEVTIPEGCQSVWDSAFENNTLLTTVKLAGSIRQVKENSFRNCTSLDNLIIPEGIERIDPQAFANCSSLKTLRLPSTLIKVFKMAFYGNSIQELYLPENLFYIGLKAFHGIVPVEKIYTKALEPCLFIDAIDYYGDKDNALNINSWDIPVHVPLGTANAYSQFLYWYKFSNIIDDEEMGSISSVQGTFTEESDFTISTYKGSIYVSGTKGKSVEIYSIEGRHINQSTGDANFNLPTGIYIVKCGHKAIKVKI